MAMSYRYATVPSPSEGRMSRVFQKWSSLVRYIQGAGEADPKNGSMALYTNAIKDPVSAATVYADASERIGAITQLEIQAEGEHPTAYKIISSYLRTVKNRLIHAKKRAWQFVNKVEGVKEELMEYAAKLQTVIG